MVIWYFFRIFGANPGRGILFPFVYFSYFQDSRIQGLLGSVPALQNRKTFSSDLHLKGSQPLLAPRSLGNGVHKDGVRDRLRNGDVVSILNAVAQPLDPPLSRYRVSLFLHHVTDSLP